MNAAVPHLQLCLVVFYGQPKKKLQRNNILVWFGGDVQQHSILWGMVGHWLARKYIFGRLVLKAPSYQIGTTNLTALKINMILRTQAARAPKIGK